MGDPADQESRRRRAVRRGEGEVTQWPRGVAGYVSKGPPDATPSPEEDRVANRIQIAVRLLSVLRGQGRDVTDAVPRLRAAEEALRAGDRAGAAAAVDRLLAELDRVGSAGPTRA